MIVAIERSKFIYLYKYNKTSIDVNQIIDLKVEQIIELLKENDHLLIEEFNRILPIFEQDHEVILLEIDKQKITIESKLTIFFKAILSIYPLTNIGSQLLQGKINENFIVQEPVFENIIQQVKIIRTLENRKLAAFNLLKLFSLNLEDQTINLFNQILKKVLLSNNSNTNFNLYLEYLISYNKTPNNIPDGNVEFLCKIGIVVLNYLQIDESNFFKGPFYKSCLKYRDEININSIFNSYSIFTEIQDNDLISSLESLKSKIDIDMPNIDIFKASYFFLAYKTFLNKNDKNLVLLKNDIEQLIFDDEHTAGIVLTMIGYAFSFELLYESLHILKESPLIKTSLNESFNEKVLVINTNKKEKKIIDENKETDNKSHKEIISEDISTPIVLYESNINNDNTDKQSLIIFDQDESSLNQNKPGINNEKTKSVNEIQNWINDHKTISKKASSEWNKFIKKSLKYGNHNLSDIVKKARAENMEVKLTAKILKELEMFFA